MSDGTLPGDDASVNTQRCPRCNCTKPLADFTSSTGKMISWCRPCKLEDNRRWRKTEKGRAAVRRHRAKWLQTAAGRQSKSRVRKKYNDNRMLTLDGRQVTYARKKARKAKRAGKLIPEPCRDCGSTDQIHMHHPDYGKPLEVVWLCPTCHNRLHGKVPLKLEKP